mgnify:FL=1
MLNQGRLPPSLFTPKCRGRDMQCAQLQLFIFSMDDYFMLLILKEKTD